MVGVFYSVEEFANILKVSHATIRRAIKAGRIMACRPGIGKKSPYRIHESEILRVLNTDYEKIIEEIKK